MAGNASSQAIPAKLSEAQFKNLSHDAESADPCVNYRSFRPKDFEQHETLRTGLSTT